MYPLVTPPGDISRLINGVQRYSRRSGKNEKVENEDKEKLNWADLDENPRGNTTMVYDGEYSSKRQHTNLHALHADDARAEQVEVVVKVELSDDNLVAVETDGHTPREQRFLLSFAHVRHQGTDPLLRDLRLSGSRKFVAMDGAGDSSPKKPSPGVRRTTYLAHSSARINLVMLTSIFCSRSALGIAYPVNKQLLH